MTGSFVSSKQNETGYAIELVGSSAPRALSVPESGWPVPVTQCDVWTMKTAPLLPVTTTQHQDVLLIERGSDRLAHGSRHGSAPSDRPGPVASMGYGYEMPTGPVR